MPSPMQIQSSNSGLVYELGRLPGWTARDGLRAIMIACVLMCAGVFFTNSGYGRLVITGRLLHALSALYADVVAFRAVGSFIYREWKNWKAMRSIDRQRAKSRGKVGTCCVCMDADVTHVIVSCGHACTCTRCSLILCSGPEPTCPVCRTVLKSRYSNRVNLFSDNGPFSVVPIENADDFGVKRVIIP